jgi:tetratricopeptide (TPR) repeat protein
MPLNIGSRELDSPAAADNACNILGARPAPPLLATAVDQRRHLDLAAYDEGRQAAKRAVEMDPRDPEAHFWYGTNTARWGQTRGVVQSLFLLPLVRQEIQTVLELDPQFTPVYALAGNVLYEVPPLMGGDLRKAEEMFRKGLQQDSHFTGIRIGLAKTLIKLGRTAEARNELQAVLNEKNPRNMGEWVMKDTKEARQLLQGLDGN